MSLQGNSQETKKAKNKYISIGVLAFTVVAAALILGFLLFKIDSVKNAFSSFIAILQPIIVGFVVAYLVNPIMKFLDKYFVLFFRDVCRFKSKGTKIARVFSVIISLLIFMAAITALVYLVVPQVINSVISLVNTLPDKIDALIVSVTEFFEKNPQFSGIMTTVLDYEKEWLENDLMNWATTYAGKLASGVVKTASFLWDLVIGFIVAVYVLFSKESFKAQIKKAVYAFAGKKKADRTVEIIRKSNEVFSGFIIGKLIDSLIIGIICFIGVTLLKMPFAVLVSVVVGVTNIIPVFGPYIGAVPCIFIITIVDPLKGLYFLIFIILLQTFDGNILGPKILGDSTGLPPFWVVFSIVLGGGLFGVAGMVIGVPLFAVIYYLLNETVRYRLSKSGLPVETEDYIEETIEYIAPIEDEKTQEEGEDTVKKKELLIKLDELVDSMNTLQRQLAAVRQENEELKTELKMLKTQPQIKEDKPAEEKVSDKKTSQGFTVVDFDAVETETTEPNSPKTENGVVAEDIVVTETEINLSDAMEYSAVAIGKVVQESIKYTAMISACEADNKKELLSLIMGKGEVAKADIFAIAEGESDYNTKCGLIDSVVNDTVDYFKSVVGQI